jgi:hypothetical protein
MDKLKEMVTEYITVEHDKEVNGKFLGEALEDYINKGYTEFKVVLVSNHNVTTGASGYRYGFKITARGEKEKIREHIRKWYPEII